MKQLSLNVDLTKLNLTEEDKVKNSADIVLQVIDNIIITYAQQSKGLVESDRKAFYSIHDKIEKSKLEKFAEGDNYIELSDEELGFIRKCFRETKLIPNDLLRQIEDNIAKTRT